ncbi:TPA: hypothetical protein DCL30_05825 [Candidatus Peribacteria bacterium]|nr:MAG: hypothetical protein A2529_00215 [Candidatus Peribacteria bacterium RIFOXYD2_FULL_58_15]HAI99013.1 hypothetical protein [Candidatus Peribacteria bacterium]HAS34818.1 hypothetical protein [Candidatus Peribacteria bacterium]
MHDPTTSITGKVCANAWCRQFFEVTEDDRQYLERVAPSVGGKKYSIPPPTHCPDCRQQRRLAWRNERFMYRRKCDFSGKEIVSMYPPNSPFKVYEQEIWWSDKWNALKYGRDFDFSRPFFEQFRELQLEVPRVALVNKQSENAHYTNHSGKNKNCYLSSVTFESEDIYYSDWVIDHCRDCVDCSYLNEGCELCYETYYAWGSYRAFFCDFIKRCRNVWFCYDCMSCTDCFMCVNLRNKQYCIENKQYSKEEYEKRMAKIFPLSSFALGNLRKEYIRRKERVAVHPATYQVQSEDSTGDLLFSSKDCKECFDSINMQDCRYCTDAIDVKDALDIYHVGWAEMMYECHAITNAYNLIACHFTYDNKNAMYCDCTQNSHDLFGCAGMNQASFCVLNKQYSEKEYRPLVEKIIEHMRKTGEWGEFFPLQFIPFGYNQSRAQEYFPLTKDQATARGIPWSQFESPPPDVKRIISASQLPESIAEVPDDILEWAVRCELSQRPFRIIKQELDFYRRTGLPIPRRHPDQRYLDRMAQRRPRKLSTRDCMKCGKKIETAYAPGRPEIVYCEKCYLKEVY